MRASRKEVVVTDGKTTKTHGITHTIPTTAENKDMDLKRWLSGLEQYTQNYATGIFLAEIIHTCDPRSHEVRFEAGMKKEANE